ncbi:DUF505 domain-containing protein [Thermopetrobacter sp. TC1]|uniref:DUF505 domain-containing protein n=1 Tax=Thermopetrobacter sp. TC1 TaxID=1495045 RepID=UPI00056DB283|nr:DUF505 domain-containing protein [Thermopetrobacter sp. TC1]
MIITKEHAIALENMRKDAESGKAWTDIEEVDRKTYLELEVQGLAREDGPLKRIPTTLGKELAEVIRALVLGGKLPTLDQWPDGWRFIGSDIITLLRAADRAGRVGPLGEKPLLERGLAEESKGEDGSRRVILSEAGKNVLRIWRALDPEIAITAELANHIRHLMEGPAESARLSTGSHEEHMLEGMRLIAYSAPNSDIYAFTTLGQAVKRTLELGGFVSEGYALSEEILKLLAACADGVELDAEGYVQLEALGYVRDMTELLPAGEWALEVWRLWRCGDEGRVWTFSIEAEEADVLEAICRIEEKRKDNPDLEADFETIRREMIDRKARQYKALLERYGRRLKEMPEKFRLIAEKFAEAKDLARWYDDNFELREALLSLEAVRLVHSGIGTRGQTVYAVTETGHAVRRDQERNHRDVTATAVKAVSIARRTYDAPARAWWDEARAQQIVGSMEATESGRFYAHLAETVERLPLLTRYEMEVFHRIPDRGMTVDEVYAALEDKLDRERIRWALEKLETRHLIDILPDGNVVETEAGQLMDRALAGVPEGFGNPVNPVVYRLLKALREVGSLYVKERKVRILPRNVKEAMKRSGLSQEAFENALEQARAAGLIGRNSINEAGLLLLEAVERMSPRASEERAYAA